MFANRSDGGDILSTIEDAREALLRVRNHARLQIRKQTNSAQLITRAAKQAAQVEKDLSVLKDAVDGEREALNEILSHIALDVDSDQNASPHRKQEKPSYYKDGRLDVTKAQYRFPVVAFESPATTANDSTVVGQFDAEMLLFPGLVAVGMLQSGKHDFTVVDTFDVSEPKRRRITIDDAGLCKDIPRKYKRLAFCITAAGNNENKLRAYACKSEDEKVIFFYLDEIVGSCGARV